MKLFFSVEFAKNDAQKVEKIGVIGASNEAHIFDSVPAFCAFLEALPRGSISYCHNGGRCSFFFLFDFFSGAVTFNGGRIVRGFIGDCEIRDSWLIAPVELPAGLDALAGAKETQRIFTVFAREVGEKITLAGSSFARFMRMEGYLKRDLYHKNGNYDRFFRRFFFGGRCEVFRSGELSDLEFYDINSAYPFAMYSKHPWGLVYAEVPQDKITGWTFVECKGVSCGAFPFRDCDGKTSYPRDKKRRIYHVTGWEYLMAISLGLFNGEIIHAWQHVETRDFRRFVDFFYERKKRANPESAEYMANKLALNSLYGKFAQFPDNYSYYYLFEPHRFKICDKIKEKGVEYQISDIMPNGMILGRGEMPKEKREYINVATSASIAGLVRAKLLESLAKSKGVAYCDTDSIACAQFSGGALSANALGAWKKLGHIKKGVFLGKKLYCLEMSDGTIKKASKGAYLGVDDFTLMKRGGKALSRGVRPVFNVRRGTQSIVIDKEIAATAGDVWVEDFYEMIE